MAAQPIHVVQVEQVAQGSQASPSASLTPSVGQAFQPDSFGPAIAAEIAQLVVRYALDCVRHAEVHPTRAIDVIDLAPGNGCNGHQLIRALQRAARHADGLRFRYLPVVPDHHWIRTATAVPELAASLQRGQLLPLVGDADQPSSLQLASTGDAVAIPPDASPLTGAASSPAFTSEPSSDTVRDASSQASSGTLAYACHNPVVILAHDIWARLPQRLLAVHYGKLLEADLAFIRQRESAAEEGQEWHPVEPALQNGAFASLFSRYLDEFNSSPIAYPEGAIDALRRWRQHARHGYLLLAAGTGMAGELKMRLHTFPDLFAGYRDDGRLPVHYGLLAYWARLHGAATVERDLPDGRAMQLVMEAAGGSDAGARLAALDDGFDPTVFDRQALLSTALRALARSGELEQQRQLLVLSGHDPLLLAETVRDLIIAFSRVTHPDRAAWRAVLEQVWANFVPELSVLRLHEKLANVAMHCGHWQLARDVLLRGMQHHGECAADLANLAWCEMRTGQLQQAIALAERALAAEPTLPLAQQVMARLQERVQQRDARWQVELRHPQLPLVLEPLDLSHAAAYFFQYRDPQIAIMTGLPALRSVDEVREWIRSSPDDPGRVSFAVMHRDHGFVAYINLAVSAHASFFCFWTGVDFQGGGFATAAARLVLNHAADMGVTVMLTSAYKDNRRSIRALQSLGFVRLASQALPPDQDRVFFALIHPSAGEVDAHRELVAYYQREQLPIKFTELDGANAP